MSCILMDEGFHDGVGYCLNLLKFNRSNTVY